MSVPDPGTICTGDTVSATLTRFSFLAPGDLWINDAFAGMLFDLTQSERFTQCGAITVEQAREVFVGLWESLDVAIDQVGAIIPFAGTLPLGGNVLPCDGRSLVRGDFAELFARIGTTYGAADGAHFNIPDLRSRAIVGAGQGPGLSNYNVGDAGGEEAHQLVLAETPSHTHTYTQEAVAAATFVPTVPVSIPNVVPGVTSAAGGDGAHNNIQPFLAVTYAIIVG